MVYIKISNSNFGVSYKVVNLILFISKYLQFYKNTAKYESHKISQHCLDRPNDT